MQHPQENLGEMGSGEKEPDNGERHSEEIVRPRRIRVSDLLGSAREAILEHAGQDYRLRVTSKGKLILTK
jgi:hemin uptake protein HemP